MAPVELEPTISLIPTVARGSHVLVAAALSTLVARTIYRSYLTLPPSSATRNREPLRRGHVKLFVTLATLSLATATYFAGSLAWLSYRIWAGERGVELPSSWIGDKGAFRGGEHPGRVDIVRWLNDTPLYQEAYEIVAEKARYFWWGQQVSLATISFSTFLSIEGRRRHISHLWAFLLLGQLVSLSYAQNLFFVAVLLTPVPLPENTKALTRSSVPISSTKYSQLKAKIIPNKPDGWLPHPAFYITILLSFLATISLVPYASNTSSFNTVTVVSQLLPISTLLLPYILPERLGTTHRNPHSAHKTYVTLFRTISTVSALLHVKSTTLALFYNTPDSHYYRHTLAHPFKSEHRSALNRSSTSVTRLLGAVSEHPLVSAVGYDVLLSGLSLGLWTSIRNLDPKNLLAASIPFKRTTVATVVEGAGFEAERDADADDSSEIVVASPTKKRGRGRPKKAESTISNDDAVAISTAKPRGKKATDADSAYRPPQEGGYEAEGDEEAAEDDWEAAALTWGLITAGLGVGSAAVYGAESVAR